MSLKKRGFGKVMMLKKINEQPQIDLRLMIGKKKWFEGFTHQTKYRYQYYKNEVLL
jgi:hypothetical protein